MTYLYGIVPLNVQCKILCSMLLFEEETSAEHKHHNRKLSIAT